MPPNEDQPSTRLRRSYRAIDGVTTRSSAKLVPRSGSFDPPCSIDEFLGLGYHVGWFGLEQIVYQPEAALAYFAQPDPDARECKSARMNFLRSHLSIRPVALSLERIARLTGKYSSFLVVPDEPDET